MSNAAHATPVPAWPAGAAVVAVASTHAVTSSDPIVWKAPVLVNMGDAYWPSVAAGWAAGGGLAVLFNDAKGDAWSTVSDVCMAVS